jgi:hypothetical protein
MKKIFISLLMVIFAFTPKITMNAQTLCDIVYDFETDPDPEYLSYWATNKGGTTTNGNSGSVSIIEEPGNTSNHVLKTANGSSGYEHGYLQLKFTLPEGKTLADYEDNLKFDLYLPTTGDQNDKAIKYYINSGAETNLPNSSGTGQWHEGVMIPLSSLDGTTTEFSIRIGANWGSTANFYIDNLTLEAKPESCTPVDPEEDATLSSLSVTPGTLTPAFSSAITSYTVNVANDVESITIAAVPKQDGATVAGDIGTKSLDVGDNSFTVTVTAPNGEDTKDYTIVVTRADENINCDTEFDFENDAATYTGNNVTNIAIVDNPIATGNSSAKALKFTVTNYNAVIKFPVKEGKLSDNYSRIEFDVATGASSNQGGKQIVFGSSTDGNTFSTENKGVSSFTGNDQNIYTTWRTLSIEISSLTSIKDKDGTLWFGLGVHDNANAVYYFDNIRLIAKDGTCPRTYRWTPGESSTEWTATTNWTPNGVPGSLDKVIIPAASSYPALPENVEIKSILFQPGAEISNQHHLTGDYKAYVQYDFSSGDAHDRWHMLSIPLKETFVGDFTFGGYPRTFFQLFGTDGWDAGTDLLNSRALIAGDAFLLWVENATYSAGAEKGLGKKNGILEIPFHESDVVKGSGVHPNHEFNSSVSTFYNYKKDGDEYVNSETSVTATRSADAYKLAGETVSTPLVFASDDDYSSDFALVGNPFMSTIDFSALATSNSDQIKNNYQIWTGKGDAAGFTGYNPNGTWGVDVSETTDNYIAPLQSFFVEKSDNYNEEGANLEFNISISATGEGTLRSAVNAANKLEIVASNETASVLTFIAQREEGQMIAGNADARKMLTGVSRLPEVYTLKPAADGSAAVLGANIIPAGAVSIPVGLFTSHTGAMSLTFKGMDSYENTTITFVDNAADNRETDLTGLSSYRYDFNFEPATADGGILPVEDRFFIRLAPGSLTGLQQTPLVPVLVYSKNQAIHIVSDPSNLIKQVRMYNAQGILAYANNRVNASSCIVDYPADIPTGVCIIKVITEQGIKNVKLIK